jgi:hypothetical protein
LDETFQTYLNRVARLTLPATHQSQLPHIQQSPKFKPLSDGTIEAVSFPGYTVTTPPWGEDSENSDFYKNLQEIQTQLSEKLDPGLFIPVPPESFHLTLADLIWDSAYCAVVRENPDFEEQLKERILPSFQLYQQSLSNGSMLCFQLLGLMIRPRAIAVCLAPKDEDTYNRLLKFRRAIYQNSGLMALGIEQQYHFTAHVTLGYFGEIPANLDRDRLLTTISDISQGALTEEGIPLCAGQVELRKFDDMMHYYRQPDWPILEF